MVDVVEEAEGEVRVHAAGADVGGVEAGAGDAFVEFLCGGVNSGTRVRRREWGVPLVFHVPQSPIRRASGLLHP